MGYPTNVPTGSLASGQLGGGSQTYVDGDAVKVVDSAGIIRVYLGNIPNGDYGLQVVSPDGATVIIDGTSNMFKISATGTFSLAGPNGKALVTTSTTLTALGTFSTARSVVSMISIESTSSQRPSVWVDEADVGDISWVIGRRAEIRSSLNGSSEETVTFAITGYTTTNWSAVTSWARYYVLAETAI